MNPINIYPSGLKAMIADYMEKGFLENIINMFKHDVSLYAFIGDMMKDERFRVRIGISALLETLKKEEPENISKAIPSILPLLRDQNPVLRSDAAYLLGMIGYKDACPFLREAASDEDENVRIIAREAIEEIESGSDDV
ncbi:MAG: HEAT repeat domain-containing protein [Thermodesulfovibrionales bacterium]|nr:HEAT repeat domain-containing protein [Thermodesulfovibrionales bacterium]